MYMCVCVCVCVCVYVCVCVRVCVSCSAVFVYVYNIMRILCTGVYMCALYSVNCLASDCVYIQQ